MPRFAPLGGDIKTDVLVIGGGLAGILCAYRLSQAGVDCVLVEQGELCRGVTGNTTAKITAQHGLIYDKLLRQFGVEKARLYLEANLDALARYRDLSRSIDCDFEERDSFVYALNGRETLERELEALARLGYGADFAEDLPLPLPAAGAVRFRKQAQFHPLKFASGISEGLKIFTHTKVRELAPGRAMTDCGVISAQKIIVATHFPMLNKHGCYFIKLYQHRSYVIALKGAPVPPGMYVDEAENGLSFREYGGLLLLGGGGHRTGKDGGGWNVLERFARRKFQKAQIVGRWATQDCMTLDGVPYIGPYAKNTSGIYVATGFNKWGMTSAMAAANILTDLVQGKENPYAKVFAPHRTVMRPQLAINIGESAFNLLTPTAPRCPHMGCALKYNRQEHSWDCPCHGSRFAEDGRLLDGPATDDKEM